MRAALLVLVPSIAAAQPDLAFDRAVIVGRVDDGAWTDAPTEARADQKAELAAVVIGHRGRRRTVLAPAGVDKVSIGGRAMATESLGEVRVQWSTVEPHGFRTSKATNGATSEFYSNVSTEPKTFGTWLDFDHIDYFERAGATDARIPATVTSGEPDAQVVAGLGTVRYKVDVEIGGTKLASPGADAVDTFGMLSTVHRVSIRRGDDFLGWLSSYILVPEVFGSAGNGRNNQTDRYVGADCADVLVGALRKMGRTDLGYTNVAGLPSYSKRITGSIELDEHGTPATPITGVLEGDIIRIDYGGDLRHHTPRDWDHVAALWQDKSDPNGPFHGGPDGKLDGFDLVIHMGHPHLVIEPLARQAPATIDVLRWRQK